MIPTNSLSSPWVNKFCAHLRKNIISRKRKKSSQKIHRLIIVLYVHALTNVQPTYNFKKKKFEFGLAKSDQSWFF
jgi:hypothetical protein